MTEEEKYKEAQRIRRNIGRQIDRLRCKKYKVLAHSDESHVLELRYMDKMIELDKKLFALGYRVADENEKYTGRLVLITQEWLDIQRKRADKRKKYLDDLKSTDPEVRAKALTELVQNL